MTYFTINLKAEFLMLAVLLCFFDVHAQTKRADREREAITTGWKFYKYDHQQETDHLIYDARPAADVDLDKIAADAKPTEAIKVEGPKDVLKAFILPGGNDFIKDPSKHYKRPAGNPGANFPFVQRNFDDSAWENVNLPHDWAIAGPFYTENNPIIGGGMGRLPVQGVGWYRKKVMISSADRGKTVYLEVDGAMSYAMVWLNGKLVGGWPYGYASWRIDLTPYLTFGAENQLAIRVDNPAASSRWYPGAGIYRNVWLTKVNPVHVANWGTFMKTLEVSSKRAKLNLDVRVKNTTHKNQAVEVSTTIYRLDTAGNKQGNVVSSIKPQILHVGANNDALFVGETEINNPKLWYPYDLNTPNRYVAITSVKIAGKEMDTYQTEFGIRKVKFDAQEGLLINGIKVKIKGVNQHADLGSLGMAFNYRAAERQLQMLKEMGCNAIRMAHNPPAPELLELADKMGFLVVDEIYDSWELKKTPLDFHLIFPEWYEQDLRALIRRDKNHPSVILWSYGNEVGEQYTDEDGAAVAKKLHDIVKDEDPTRLTTLAMNYAKPNMPLPQYSDVIGLNYQGEGIRDADAYKGLKGITTSPMFPVFHEKFPDRAIISTENAAAISSRGEYLFPVNGNSSSPVKDNLGGNPLTHQVSAYELYSVDFGASADKVFASLERNQYVAGGFAWTGWDYLGEPTPYYSSRSSYFGIIDMAGFKKDRFYLYQSQWLPEKPMVHLLPHWNWPDRVGKVTPVHVFTSGDEAELFLNGKSLGRKKLGPFEYRLRWDEVVYEPGTLMVQAYKDGKEWAKETIKTTKAAVALQLIADRSTIQADGQDLSFVTVKVVDEQGMTVPDAKPLLKFSVEGAGEIVAADNGDATDMSSFTAKERKAFNGLCLLIIRSKRGIPGTVNVKVVAEGMKEGGLVIESKNKLNDQ